MANFAKPLSDCWVVIEPFNKNEEITIINFYKPGGEGAWREVTERGPIKVGDKTYMSYLTPQDLLSWARKDFKHGYSCNVELYLNFDELSEKYPEEEIEE